MRAVRILLLWLTISALTYALWQGPNWDHVPFALSVVLPLYVFQFPGILVHGPHGGYGDWRDPAIIIPVTALFYAMAQGAVMAVRHVWRSRGAQT